MAAACTFHRQDGIAHPDLLTTFSFKVIKFELSTNLFNYVDAWASRRVWTLSLYPSVCVFVVVVHQRWFFRCKYL